MSAEIASQASPVWPRVEVEENRREHLLLDPIPQEEQHRMVLDSMLHPRREYWIVVGVLAAIALSCFIGVWLWEIFKGLGITGMRRVNFWGVYIASFVFWIGISHSGTFVSAILRVFKVEYRRPFTRAAELMTTCSLLIAFAFLGIDIGRVWRAYWILPYPNERMIWPNYHSPFLWDEMAIITYFVGSTLYLYLPLIPDLAMVRDHVTGLRHRIYRALAFGWRGTELQWVNLQSAIKIFAFVIIPVMFSVHTIVSWDFAMSNVEGWHSTIFGPYFVVGAIYSGVSAVIIILFLIRYDMRLDYFIRLEHFEALAKLVLIFSFAWAYFYFADLITEWYVGEEGIWNLLLLQFQGELRPFWVLMLFCNIVVPWATLWSKRIRRTPLALFFITLAINIGMYVERYLIVTGFLRRNRLPFNWSTYTPSVLELLILVGSFATFLLLYALLSRALPIIPVWEVIDGQIANALRRVGRATVTTVAELED